MTMIDDLGAIEIKEYSSLFTSGALILNAV